MIELQIVEYENPDKIKTTTIIHITPEQKKDIEYLALDCGGGHDYTHSFIHRIIKKLNPRYRKGHRNE